MKKVSFEGIRGAKLVDLLLLSKMKFMKLGSKPDSLQTDGNNVR